VETLQGFFSPRFTDLTIASGLTDWARQVLNTVTSAAASVRSAAPASPTASPRPAAFVAGRDLPRISPGVERC
jgi:hypothetical protein